MMMIIIIIIRGFWIITIIIVTVIYLRLNKTFIFSTSNNMRLPTMFSTEQRPDSRDNPVTSHSLLNVVSQKQGLVLVVL